MNQFQTKIFLSNKLMHALNGNIINWKDRVKDLRERIKKLNINVHEDMIWEFVSQGFMDKTESYKFLACQYFGVNYHVFMHDKHPGRYPKVCRTLFKLGMPKYRFWGKETDEVRKAKNTIEKVYNVLKGEFMSKSGMKPVILTEEVELRPTFNDVYKSTKRNEAKSLSYVEGDLSITNSAEEASSEDFEDLHVLRRLTNRRSRLIVLEEEMKRLEANKPKSDSLQFQKQIDKLTLELNEARYYKPVVTKKVKKTMTLLVGERQIMLLKQLGEPIKDFYLRKLENSRAKGLYETVEVEVEENAPSVEMRNPTVIENEIYDLHKKLIESSKELDDWKLSRAKIKEEVSSIKEEIERLIPKHDEEMAREEKRRELRRKLKEVKKEQVLEKHKRDNLNKLREINFLAMVKHSDINKAIMKQLEDQDQFRYETEKMECELLCYKKKLGKMNEVDQALYESKLNSNKIELVEHKRTLYNGLPLKSFLREFNPLDYLGDVLDELIKISLFSKESISVSEICIQYIHQINRTPIMVLEDQQILYHYMLGVKRMKSKARKNLWRHNNGYKMKADYRIAQDKERLNFLNNRYPDLELDKPHIYYLDPDF